MIFFVLFFAIPIIEMILFYHVGGEIGILNTLLLTVLTAFIGAFLVRAQGIATLMAARGSMSRAELPVKEIFDGICIAIAGALLMTPGFFTDTIGFLLLLPPLREYLRHEVPKHFDVRAVGSGAAPSEKPFQKQQTYSNQNTHRSFRDTDVIDGEYERVDDDK